MTTLAKTLLAAVPLVLVMAVGDYNFAHSEIYLDLSASLGRERCVDRGGKWASRLGSCVTRACYADGNCGHWAAPIHRCDRLKVDDSIAEVYFQLGDPDAIKDGEYRWVPYKGGGNPIVARIEDEKLKSIVCFSAE